MNKIFNIVWCKALRQLVVTSELSRRSAGGSASQPARSSQVPALALTALAAALFFVVPAHAANLGMPSGAILDINNGNAANSASNTADTFKTYSVTFTAAQSGNNYVLFAFRQDPAYWTFGNLSMYAAGDTSTNLFVNPLFTQGGAVQSSTQQNTTVQAPANWGVVYQAGTVPNAAGTWHAPGSPGETTTSVNTATAGSWYDGAVGSFDGIYQGVDLVAGIVYTINFTALSNQAANTAGSGSNDVEMGVFAGTCLTLTGPVANCVPDNPNFSVLATPDDAVNAGGPTSTPITSTTDTSDLGSHDAAFDGGTLVVDQDNTTSTGNHTISGNGGTIDQAGHDSTFTGTISDATPGTPGSLTIINSGNGGSVTLTGTNTYSGGTTVEQQATLQGDTTSLQGNIENDGTVRFDQNTDGTYAGTISGTGDLEKTGTGTVTLTGANDYTGDTTIGSGTLALSGDGAIGEGHLAVDTGTTFDATGANHDTVVSSLNGNGNVALGGHTLDITDANGTYGGTISGTGKLGVEGGTQTLTGNNTYSGGTAVGNGATIDVGSDGALGTGTVTLVDGNLHTGADRTLANDISVTGPGGALTQDAGTTLHLTGDVAGSGDFIKDGAGSLLADGALNQVGKTIVNEGSLTLAGTNGYAGGTYLNGGTLNVSSDGNLGDAAGALNFAGGTLVDTGNLDSSRDVNLVTDGHIVTDDGATTTLGGTVAGAGALDLQGFGTTVLTGNNSYAGGTHVGQGGTLVVGDDSNLGAAGTGISLDAATLHTTGDIDSTRGIAVSAGNATVVTNAGTTFVTTGDVTGSGGLVKTGLGTMQVDGNMSNLGVAVVDGTLVLNGNNSFTDNSYVFGGATLQVNSGAALGSGQGALVLNGGTLKTTGNVDTARNIGVSSGATFDIGTGTTMTSRGDLSGTGALIKNGQGALQIDGVASHTGGTTVNDGLLILAAANTYTGGNTLNGGVLAIGNDANLGDASNGVDFAGGTLYTGDSFTTARELTFAANGGTIATAGGTTLTATGNLTGSAGMVKDGAGTLDLSGVASYDGGTTVDGGTLILRGNNTYTGGTTINGGKLQISSDANLGAASGNLAINGGNLTVTQNMTTARDILIGANGATIDTLDGVTLNQQGDMSGSGGLVKLGGGTLIVSGNNSFTGGTLIDGGIIRIDSGSSLGTGAIMLKGGMLQTVATLGTGQQVIISGNSGVNVDAGTTTVLSGALAAAAGDGCFTKTGKGKLSLTGAANLASGTCVQDGTLSANGSLVSSFVQVDQGAMLRGTGFIGGPVNVEGTLAAGNSPGTLTVQGTVTMQSTSTLQVDIDGMGTANGAGNYSRVLVTGAGNRFIADGTLAPTLRGITGDASNTYVPALGASYRIVTADGGVVGRFASLTQPTSGLAANTRFIAFYGVNDGHSIDLRVAPTSYVGFMGANAKRNGVSAASALDGSLLAQDAGSATSGQTALLYAVSALDADHVGTLVQTLSGEVHADEAAAARTAGLGMQRDVSDHLGTDVESADAAHRVWANLTRDGNRSIADNQGTGFETGTDRTTAGVDLYAENGTVLGVAATHHDTNVIAHAGNGSIKGNSGMVYAQQALGAFVLDGVAAYGSTDWTTRRADPLGGASLESHASGKDSMASATLRMPLTTASGNRIEPYVSAIWQKVERDGSTERGASAAALSLDSLSQHGTRVLAGVAMGSKAADPLSTTLTWRAGVAVGADTGDLLDPTVHNTMSGQRFDTAAPGVGRGFVQLNANGTMRLGKSTYLYGGLTAEEGQRRSAYGVTAGVRVAF